MATLQSDKNPESRMSAGNHVVDRAKALSAEEAKAIQAPLAVFSKAHAAFGAAHGAATKAEESVHAAEAAVAEADAAQDAAVGELASKMIGDGAPRTQPFKVLRAKRPSVIIHEAIAKEVKTCKALAKAAAKWKDAKQGTKAAASALAKAASACEKALKPLASAKKVQSAARAKRDGLGLPWHRAFSRLKLAAKSADMDGGRSIFSALFEVEPHAPSHGKNPPPQPPPAPEPPVKTP